MKKAGGYFREGAIYCDNLHYNFKHNLLFKNKLLKIQEAFAFALFVRQVVGKWRLGGGYKIRALTFLIFVKFFTKKLFRYHL